MFDLHIDISVSSLYFSADLLLSNRYSSKCRDVLKREEKKKKKKSVYNLFKRKTHNTKQDNFYFHAHYCHKACVSQNISVISLAETSVT